MSTITKISLVALVAFMVWVIFGPGIGGIFTGFSYGSETVVVSTTRSDGAGEPLEEQRELEIVTLLGFDGIPAILDPTFVSTEQAEAWMEPHEPVLGLSINGDNRAYSVRMLSRHEIVNDVVGGVPVAVTW